MYTPADLFIGIRYIHARRGNHFIAFISATAILATALGVAILLTIQSIMNGFEGELRDRILGMAAHVEVHLDASNGDAGGAHDWREVAARLAADPAVAAVAPYLSRDVLVASRGQVRAVVARGVDVHDETRVTSLAAHMLDGDPAMLATTAYGVVIGAELAAQMGLALGQRLTLTSPRPLVTPAGLLPRMKRFVVVGIFEYGIEEHDAGLILIRRADAIRLFRPRADVDGLRLRLVDAASSRTFKQELRQQGAFDARDWTDTHRNLFRALKTEKLAMFVILALAIAIAAFNLVSILVVAVTEKRGDIAMLAALGMQRRSIMRVFLWQGAITGTAGVAGGLVLGWLLSTHIDAIVAGVETLLGFKILAPEIFYISAVPSRPLAGDFWMTGVFAMLLALSAPVYPAWLASRTVIAEGLRHE